MVSGEETRFKYSPSTLRRAFRQASTPMALLLVGAALAAPTSSGAAINDTGQLTCADGTSPMSCPVAGYPDQDQRYGRDAAFRDGQLTKTGAGAGAFDFTKVSNAGADLPAATLATGTQPGSWGCTRDNVTGLLWTADSPPASYTYDQAVAYAAALNAGAGRCGSTQWRLPTIVELNGLSYLGSPTAPLLDRNYFESGFGTAYWSVTLSNYLPDFLPNYAWYIAVGAAGTTIQPKSTASSVRAVSGPVTTVTLQPQADGSLFETGSSLFLDGCDYGQNHAGGGCSGTGTTYSWQAALALAANANQASYLGHSDWRVPNPKELILLVDYGSYRPALANCYWTNTYYTEITTDAYQVRLQIGYVAEQNKSQSCGVRLVRGGLGAGGYAGPDPNLIFRADFE